MVSLKLFLLHWNGNAHFSSNELHQSLNVRILHELLGGCVLLNSGWIVTHDILNKLRIAENLNDFGVLHEFLEFCHDFRVLHELALHLGDLILHHIGCGRVAAARV